MDELEIREALTEMENNVQLITESSFRANALLWPDHRISFTDNHLAYLKSHPTTNPRHYLSNLKLMLKKR